MLANSLRCAILEVTESDYPYFVNNGEAVEDSLRKFSSVKSLTISNLFAETINLALLSTFRSTSSSSGRAYPDLTLRLMIDLSNLQITGRGFTLEHGQVLSRLKSLSIFAVTEDVAQTLLNPSTLPNLRAFAPICTHSRNSRSAFVDLLPQIQSLEN